MNREDLLKILADERLTDEERDAYEQYLQILTEHAPDSLYLSPYELEKIHGGSSQVWRKLFQIPGIKRAIEIELATITEYAARKALAQLSQNAGTITSAEVSAIKGLLDQASSLKSATQQKERIIVHYIPPREEVTQ